MEDHEACTAIFLNQELQEAIADGASVKQGSSAKQKVKRLTDTIGRRSSVDNSAGQQGKERGFGEKWGVSTEHIDEVVWVPGLKNKIFTKAQQAAAAEPVCAQQFPMGSRQAQKPFRGAKETKDPGAEDWKAYLKYKSMQDDEEANLSIMQAAVENARKELRTAPLINGSGVRPQRKDATNVTRSDEATHKKNLFQSDLLANLIPSVARETADGEVYENLRKNLQKARAITEN